MTCGAGSTVAENTRLPHRGPPYPERSRNAAYYVTKSESVPNTHISYGTNLGTPLGQGHISGKANPDIHDMPLVQGVNLQITVV